MALAMYTLSGVEVGSIGIFLSTLVNHVLAGAYRPDSIRDSRV
jgi:hypothetical protein